jgi:hypothetical protein
MSARPTDPRDGNRARARTDRDNLPDHRVHGSFGQRTLSSASIELLEGRGRQAERQRRRQARTIQTLGRREGSPAAEGHAGNDAAYPEGRGWAGRKDAAPHSVEIVRSRVKEDSKEGVGIAGGENQWARPSDKEDFSRICAATTRSWT